MRKLTREDMALIFIFLAGVQVGIMLVVFITEILNQKGNEQINRERNGNNNRKCKKDL